MRFEFQLQRVFQAEFLAQIGIPPGVHVRHQGAADLACRVVAVRRLQPDEGGIRVAVDDLVALLGDQLARAVHDVVAAQGDRRGQARVEEAAAAGPQHAVEGVHDDFQGLRQGRVALALGRLAALPHLLHDGGQAVFHAGKLRAPVAGHGIGFVAARAHHQPHGVDEEGADDGRVQALIVEHEHGIVQAGLGIHDEAAGAVFAGDIAQVGRHVALPVHQRQIQVFEGGHGAAAAVGRQARHAGPFQQKGQQFGLGEDARDQLAILEVVAGQGGFVFAEPPVDLGHALVGVVDGLAFAQQGLRHVFQAERGKIPRRRAQRLDAVDDEAPGRGGKIVFLLAAMRAPLHDGAFAPQLQGYLITLGMFLEYAQVELHQVPADDGVRIVLRHPRVQAFEDLRAAVAVFQVEVALPVDAVWRPQHVDLALAAAFQRQRIQVAVGRRLDVERCQSQCGTVAGRGFQMDALARDGAVKCHRRRNETLHQVALGRADVGLVHVDAMGAQLLFQLQQVPVLLAVQAQHGTVVEVGQGQGAQLGMAFAAQQLLRLLALLHGDEGDGRLHGQAHVAGPGIRCQPEIDLRPGAGIAPVAGEDEALFGRVLRVACHGAVSCRGYRVCRSAHYSKAVQGGGGCGYNFCSR